MLLKFPKKKKKLQKHLWFHMTDYSFYFPAWCLQLTTQQKNQGKQFVNFSILAQIW
jgi:hypothetical protein